MTLGLVQGPPIWARDLLFGPGNLHLGQGPSIGAKDPSLGPETLNLGPQTLDWGQTFDIVPKDSASKPGTLDQG